MAGRFEVAMTIIALHMLRKGVEYWRQYPMMDSGKYRVKEDKPH
jgi:hypothetical protein